MEKNYTKQDIARILKNDIETPEVVTMKMNQTLNEIRETKRKKKSKAMRWQAAAAVMGIMLIGTVTVGAAGFFLWHPDVAERFDANEAQQQELEAQKVTVPVDASCTNQGVTVSLEQSLMTEKYMYIYFKITAPKDMKLSQNTFFQNSSLLLNGKDAEASYCGGVPDFSEDGTDNVTYWEYFVEWTDKNDLSGQEMTARFENLIESDMAKDQDTTLVEGTWDVTWNLEYSPSEQTFVLNQPIEGEDITVKEVTISPISIEVVYDWARKEIEETIIDENGEEEICSEFADPVVFAAQYRMKDGTVQDISCGGMGSGGYVSEEDDTYVTSFGCDKVYTVEDIESIIFMNAETEATYEMKLQ